MSKQIITLEFSYIQQAVKSLADSIRNSGIAYDLILGLTRGGIIPAGLLSYQLGNVPVLCIDPDRGYSACLLYELAFKNILVVDNIARKGNTLVHTVKEIRDLSLKHIHVGRVDTCVIHSHSNLAESIKPTYTHSQIGDGTWLKYPWDVDAA